MRLGPIVLVVALASVFGARVALAGGPSLDAGTADGGKLLAPSGAPCKVHADCRSNACISGTCRARCDATTKCATTQTCTRAGVCVPTDSGTPAPNAPDAPDAAAPSVPDRRSADEGDDDDSNDGERATEKDDEYWRSLPTTLEPPPDNRKGCSSAGTPLDADTSGALFCASAAAIALLRRKRRDRQTIPYSLRRR